MPPRMKGNISAYSADVNAGTIIDEEGTTYLFSRKDWVSGKYPDINLAVTFIAEGNRAIRVVTEAKP